MANDLAQAVTEAKQPPPVPDSMRQAALAMGTHLRPGELDKLLTRTKLDAADEAAAYFLQCLMIGIENLAQGNKLVAGRAMDDALTHFLADLKAEIGAGYASNAAELLIRNIALFLTPKKRDMVLAALDSEAP